MAVRLCVQQQEQGRSRGIDQAEGELRTAQWVPVPAAKGGPADASTQPSAAALGGACGSRAPGAIGQIALGNAVSAVHLSSFIGPIPRMPQLA